MPSLKWVSIRNTETYNDQPACLVVFLLAQSTFTRTHLPNHRLRRYVSHKQTHTHTYIYIHAHTHKRTHTGSVAQDWWSNHGSVFTGLWALNAAAIARAGTLAHRRTCQLDLASPPLPLSYYSKLKFLESEHNYSKTIRSQPWRRIQSRCVSQVVILCVCECVSKFYSADGPEKHATSPQPNHEKLLFFQQSAKTISGQQYGRPGLKLLSQAQNVFEVTITPNVYL